MLPQRLLQSVAVRLVSAHQRIPLLVLLLVQDPQEVPQFRNGEGVPLGSTEEKSQSIHLWPLDELVILGAMYLLDSLTMTSPVCCSRRTKLSVSVSGPASRRRNSGCSPSASLHTYTAAHTNRHTNTVICLQSARNKRLVGQRKYCSPSGHYWSCISNRRNFKN